MENQINPNDQDNQQVNGQPLVINVEEVKPGGAWARFWAAIVDGLVLSVFFIPVAIVFELISGDQISLSSEALNKLENNTTLGIVGILFVLVYHVGFTAQRGATPAKKLYKLKVVNYKNKEKISYGQAILREVIKIILFHFPILGVLFYLINGLFIVFSKQKRGIHDLIAGTQVVKL